MGNFCHDGDLILYDALIHNSVAEGCRLAHATARPFPHNDWEALERILERRRDKFAKVLICVEGVYSMDGDIAPVPEFVRIKKKYDCFLMVDEAHSTCVIGKTGGGVDEYFGLAPNDIDIKMGTLSKGLGTCGGYLAGAANLIEYLRYSLPGFVFSVGISPALAAATLCAVRLMQTDPSIMENMRRNVACFAREARKRRLDIGLAARRPFCPYWWDRMQTLGPFPICCGTRACLCLRRYILPVPRDQARLRFCVTAAHVPDQIVEALDKLEEAAQELGIVLPRITES